MKLQVTFGSMSVNTDTCSIGFAIDREHLEVEEADKLFSGYQLNVVISNGSPGAPPLPGMEEYREELSTIATATRFSVAAKKIGSRLRFNLSQTKYEELGRFASRIGAIEIVGEPEKIVTESEDGDDLLNEELEQVTKPATHQPRVAVDSAGNASIRALVREDGPFSDALYERLEAAGIRTVSDFEERLRRFGNTPWYEDVAGIGLAKSDELLTARIDFRQKHPIPADDEDDEPTTDDEAFRAGVQAAMSNLSADSNPYQSGSMKANEYSRGYLFAHDKTTNEFVTSDAIPE